MLKMATLEEIKQFDNDNFQPFPAWIEVNPNKITSKYMIVHSPIPVSVDSCNLEFDDLYTSDGNYAVSAYGKSWRLWYANGMERPDEKTEWE